MKISKTCRNKKIINAGDWRVQMIKKYIKMVVFQVLSTLPIDQRKIMFESNTDVKDNSKQLFEFMLKNGYADKYKMIWPVKDVEHYRKKYSQYSNVKFISRDEGEYYGMEYLFHIFTSKYCFYTHLPLTHRIGKKQKKIFLTHGTPLKDSTGLFWNPQKNTDIITTSNFAGNLRCKTFNGGHELLRVLGFPRNDALYKSDKDTDAYFESIRKDKLIIWLPTFKHHSLNSERRNDFGDEKNQDISILSEKNMDKINKKLIMENTLLIIKFHPSQHMGYITKKNYTNIIMMSNDELEKEGVDLYSLLGKSDALITDFSSVYLDYLLRGKPIGFELGDLESYQRGRGFLVDNPFEMMPGKRIFTIDDMIKFINEVSNDIDQYENDREKLKDRMHKYSDGESAKRIVDFFGL